MRNPGLWDETALRYGKSRGVLSQGRRDAHDNGTDLGLHLGLTDRHRFYGLPHSS